jgi:hypothetical protein
VNIREQKAYDQKLAAVEFVNSIRSQLGLPTVAELVPGHVGASCCPIANTIDGDKSIEQVLAGVQATYVRQHGKTTMFYNLRA